MTALFIFLFFLTALFKKGPYVTREENFIGEATVEMDSTNK